MRKPEHLLKPLAGVDRHIVLVFDGGDGLFEVFPRVAGRHIEKVALDALLGAHDLRLPARLFARVCQKEFVVHLFVGDELVRQLVRGIILGEKAQKALAALARTLFEGESAAALHDAPPRDEHADGAVDAVRRPRPDVRLHVLGHGGDAAEL